MAKVFICYARVDRDFAEVVQAKLEKAGHAISVDLDVLSAGEDWQDKLDLAIRGSHAMVVIMTPEARASENVAYEWAFALGAGLRVIVLALTTASLPPALDDLQRLDFTNKARPWDTLLLELQKVEASNPTSSVQVEPGTPPAVVQAIRGLDSLHGEERLAAVQTLAQMDHRTAREALGRALEHPVKEVRVAAASLFPDRKDPRIVPGLMEAIPEGDASEFDDWTAFVSPVSGIGAPAVPALLHALQSLTDTPKPVHYSIVDALGLIGDASALPVLLELLQHKDSDLRRTAAKALGRLGAPAAAPKLRAALLDAAAGVRVDAVESLGLLKDAAAVPDLLKLVVEDTPRIREAAAKALGNIGDRSAVPVLIETLKDENVRDATVEALGELGDPCVIPHLRPLLPGNTAGGSGEKSLEHSDDVLMTALVRLKDVESFPAIQQRIIEVRSGMPKLAMEALAQVGEAGARVLITVLDRAEKEALRNVAAQVLERVPTPDAKAAVKAWRRKNG